MNLHDFTTYCDQLVHASQSCTDRWQWVRGTEPEQQAYIRLERKQQAPGICRPSLSTMDALELPELDVNDDPSLARCSAIHPNRILSYEYHVLYSESYEVPMLLFNLYEEGGARFNLEEAWNVLNISGCVSSNERYGAITMVHHPILNRPYLSLHPCRTSELIGSLGGSINPILSFLTTYAPYLNLDLDELLRAFCEKIGLTSFSMHNTENVPKLDNCMAN